MNLERDRLATEFEGKMEIRQLFPRLFKLGLAITLLLSSLSFGLAQDGNVKSEVRVRYISSAPREDKSENNNRPAKIRVIKKGEEEEAKLKKIDPTDFQMERRVFDLINSKRKEKHLDTLKWNEDAARVARVHSENMARYNFFSHVGLDGSMIDARSSILGLDDWKSIGENIAYCKGFENPDQFVVERWMLSQGHRENLLKSSWRESGIGVAKTEDGMYFFTQVFFVR